MQHDPNESKDRDDHVESVPLRLPVPIEGEGNYLADAFDAEEQSEHYTKGHLDPISHQDPGIGLRPMFVKLQGHRC